MFLAPLNLHGSTQHFQAGPGHQDRAGMALVECPAGPVSPRQGLCCLIANPRLVDSKPLLPPGPGVWESTAGPCFPGDLMLNTAVKGKVSSQ